MLGLIRSLHPVTDTFFPLDHLKRVEEVLGAGCYQVTQLSLHINRKYKITVIKLFEVLISFFFRQTD